MHELLNIHSPSFFLRQSPQNVIKMKVFNWYWPYSVHGKVYHMGGWGYVSDPWWILKYSKLGVTLSLIFNSWCFSKLIIWWLQKFVNIPPYQNVNHYKRDLTKDQGYAIILPPKIQIIFILNNFVWVITICKLKNFNSILMILHLWLL